MTIKNEGSHLKGGKLVDRRVGIILGLLGLVGGCAQDMAGNPVTGGAHVKEQAQTQPPPTASAKQVYVYDFALDAKATEPKDEGLLPRPRFLTKLAEDDPATHAKKVVDTLATELVRDLRKAGMPAQRLASNAPLPRDGWLIRGVFTELSSGETPRRAIIGFGSGKSDMEVQVGVCDLSKDPNASFIVFGTITDPSKLPGGVVTRNPYVVAAKFVVEKGAPSKDVEHTAQAIANEIVKLRDQVRRGEVTLPDR
jgi:hypothetical protein